MKQPLSIKYLDMLLHAQQVTPPNGYMLKWYELLHYKENPAI